MVDLERAIEGLTVFLEALGVDDPERSSTAVRSATAWRDDLLTGQGVDPKQVLSDSIVVDEETLVSVERIPFTAICSHHLLPFDGAARVAYIVRSRACGLSQIPRLVEILSRRLTLQEEMTSAVVRTLMEVLDPIAAMCITVARHGCVSDRGIRSETTVRAESFAGRWESPSGRSEIDYLMNLSY